MEKRVVCKKCNKVFEVVGERGNMKEVTQSVTCPYDNCGETNELLWPVGMRFFVRLVPVQM
jgi:hypothetical protein